MKHVLFLICLLFLQSSCSDNKKPAARKPPVEDFTKANEYRDAGKRDSAFLYFNSAKDLYIQKKNTVGAGICLINMAMISTDAGDFFGAQELSLNAVSYFSEGDPSHYVSLLSAYNTLGMASYNLKQYSKSREFYTKSLRFVTDSSYSRVLKNNIANAYRKEGDFRAALAAYRAVLDEEKDSINYARTLSNYAYTKWLENGGYNPVPELRTALLTRIQKNDVWGQNSSYAQLADFYMSKRPDSALVYSIKMYQIASSLNSPDDQVEALQKLIPLSSTADSKSYFNRYRQLEDSIQNARNSARNQFALIRFETEKHKADNLALQHTNTVRNAWIISLAIMIITGTIGSVLLYRRREKYLALKAANEVRSSQLKTSKKVHDVVANGLYRVMSEVEHSTEMDREKVLDDLENLYEKSRDISYDDILIKSDVNFASTIAQLITSFGTPTTKVLVAGNEDKIWTDLSQKTKNELYYVLQELMVNMTKHSQASSVVIKFERISNILAVRYTDNGIGIQDGIDFKNGLTNTGNRIKSIGGTITFGTSTSRGLKVEIDVPV